MIWAFPDVPAAEGGFVLVPCPHKSNVEMPEEIRTGGDNGEYIHQIAFKAGDLMIVGLTVAQGMRPK